MDRQRWRSIYLLARLAPIARITPAWEKRRSVRQKSVAKTDSSDVTHR